MKHRWPEWTDQDEKEQQELLRHLHKQMLLGKCSVFLGAGLSQPAGYPEWRALLKQMVAAAGMPDAEETVMKARARDLPDLADDCKCAMGEEEYLKFLGEQFDPAQKEPYRSVHADLVTIPFNAYLTTNYDPCIEVAASRQGQGNITVHSYPQLPAGDLKSGCVYHIHGRAYDEDGNSLVRTMILTATDYDEAYHQNQAIKRILHDVLLYQTVLFAGVSLRDPGVSRVLDSVREEQLQLAETRRARSLGPAPEAIHFALRPTVFVLSDNARPGSERRNLPEEQGEEEEFFTNWSIKVIRYPVFPHDDQYHRALSDIVRGLCASTPVDETGRLSDDAARTDSE